LEGISAVDSKQRFRSQNFVFPRAKAVLRFGGIASTTGALTAKFKQKGQPG
jgi:hypothetical protein